jgi:hypothetical protein
MTSKGDGLFWNRSTSVFSQKKTGKKEKIDEENTSYESDHDYPLSSRMPREILIGSSASIPSCSSVHTISTSRALIAGIYISSPVFIAAPFHKHSQRDHDFGV